MNLKNLNKKFALAFSTVLIMLSLAWSTTAFAATSPSLGTAATYAILANTFNYNVGLTTLIGTAGQSTLGYVGAFQGGGASLAVTGNTEVNNAARTQAGLDQNNALNNVVDGLNVQSCTSIGAIVDLASYDMDGAGPNPPGTFTPGCYSSTGAMNVGGGGTVTLSGSGTFIFRPAGALNTTANSIVQLAAGASECDVFWAPIEATTLGADSTFVGSVLDAAGITISNNVTWLGRALAYGGTVTADSDTVTVPVCTPPATLHVVKAVVNDNTGVSTASDFDLYVKLAGVNVAGSPAAGAAAGTSYSLAAGTYVVSEDAFAGYTSTFSGDCDEDGNITLTSGADLTCTVTNNDVTPAPLPSTLSVVKTVINDSGRTQVIADFALFVNGASVVSGVVNTFPANASYTVTETFDPNYTKTFSGDCNASGIVSLVPGDNKICIITNNDIALPPGGGGGGGAPIPPLMDVVKVPNPLALPAGPGKVTYTYTLKNIGPVAVQNITMIGDTCSPIILISGDIDADKKLDLNETWVYTCSTTLSETHTNIITATGWANGISTTDIASATVIVGSSVVPPLIHVTKIPYPLTLPAVGGMVTYTKKITNPGIVALKNVRLTDDQCSKIVFISGDKNSDSKLDVTETWTYTCTTNITETTLNTAVATGEANGIKVRDFAIATVTVASPLAIVPSFPDTGNSTTENILILSVIIAGIFAASLLLYNTKRNS